MEEIAVKPGNEVFIEMKNNLTAQWINDLKSSFISAVEDKADIVLIFNEHIETDLTFLQLLCSMHQALNASGKLLTVTGCNIDLLKEVAARAGYNHRSNCTFNKNNKCFLSGGYL